MTWKHISRYWPFVIGIHRWTVDTGEQWIPLTREPVMAIFGVFLDISVKQLTKQSSCRWFKTPCGVTVLFHPVWFIIFTRMYQFITNKPLNIVAWCSMLTKNGLITTYECVLHYDDIDGVVQDCSNSSALAMELLQSCTKPSLCTVKLSSFLLATVCFMIYWWFNTPISGNQATILLF